MWKILGVSLLALAALGAETRAEDRYVLNQNQTGLDLPGVNLPQGYDEVRTSDGTSCRSSNSGDGAYADMGVIGGNDDEGRMKSGAVYGRVVVPLGKRGTRLDCRRLYDLEIERLQAEVRLLKAGLNHHTGAVEEPGPEFEQGWSAAPNKTASVEYEAPKPIKPMRTKRDRIVTGSVTPIIKAEPKPTQKPFSLSSSLAEELRAAIE